MTTENRNNLRFVFLKSVEKNRKYYYDEIIRFESDGKNAWLYLFAGDERINRGEEMGEERSGEEDREQVEEKKVCVFHSLKELERKLEHTGLFIRCSRFDLINVEYVVDIDQKEWEFELKNGDIIGISRTYKQAVRNVLDL